MAERFLGPSGPEHADAGAGPHAEQDSSPLADEASRLMAAMQAWAQRTFPEPPDRHGGPECQWCPLCQFVSILRGEHPEVTDRVAAAGSALAGAFRAIVDVAVQSGAAAAYRHGTGGARGSAAGGPDGAAGGRGDATARPQSTSRVQHIRLTDES